jgi:hypothetical protein
VTVWLNFKSAVQTRNVSRQELADLLSLSPNRVSELRIAGVITAVSPDPWMFDAIACAKAYVEYRKAKASERAQSGDRESLEAKLRKYRSNLSKDGNRLGKLKEEALSITDARDTHEFVRIVLLDEVRKLPEQIADRISGIRDAPDMYEAIEKPCHAVLCSMRDKCNSEGRNNEANQKPV